MSSPYADPEWPRHACNRSSQRSPGGSPADGIAGREHPVVGRWPPRAAPSIIHAGIRRRRRRRSASGSRSITAGPRSACCPRRSPGAWDCSTSTATAGSTSTASRAETFAGERDDGTGDRDGSRAIALPQPRRRHLRGRDGVLRDRRDRLGTRLRPGRGRGRLRQRRASRPVRHPAAKLRPVPQPGRWDVRGRHRARGPGWTATLRPRRPSPISTTTATSTSTSATTCSGTRSIPAVPESPTATLSTAIRARSSRLRDHVFRNDGGRFVDVTAAAGFADPDGRGPGRRRRRP